MGTLASGLGYEPDAKIIDFIRDEKFTLSAEIIPPRNGAEQEKLLNQIETLVKSGAQFLSVTKGAGGSLRGGSLPIAHAIKDRFKVPAIAHFTCRDITPQEVENQLMDHHYFGIRNILALRGDPPSGQPNWEAKDGSYNYAYELIEQIMRLNRGEYIKRPDGPKTTSQEKTDFCIGAAVYPEHENPLERTEFFKKKIDCGAEYAITQMLFDADIYKRFLDSCEKNQVNVPVLPGTRFLKHQEQAQLMEKLFKVSVPEKIMKALPTKAEHKASGADLNGLFMRSVDITLQLLEEFKQAGAPGVHFFVLTNTKGVAQVIETVKSH